MLTIRFHDIRRSAVLKGWIESSDLIEIHQFHSPTRPISDEYLDIVFYKHLERTSQVSFRDKIP